MKTLFVKELSRLTKVSIRTLHYYDKIGLLKPSDRLPNGYRVYSEKDLHKLEKIIVLKFFGFTLARIKQLLSNESATLEQLETQLILLQSEVSFLQEAQRDLLIASINEYKRRSTVNWHQILELISDYTIASKELKFHTSKILPMAKHLGNPPHRDISQFQDIWQKLKDKIQRYENNENT